MKFVIGLGNPGSRYERTRHNIGFDVIAVLRQRNTASKPQQQFQAEVSDCQIDGERALLIMPQTYMNRSGISVAQAVRFYRVPTEDLLVVCDDMNLPFGQCRLKAAGTAGGQKGLQDILQHLGTNDVPRLRIGVGRPPANFDAADYVLGRFSKAEQGQLEEITSRAADAVETWTRNGIELAMNRINGPQTS